MALQASFAGVTETDLKRELVSEVLHLFLQKLSNVFIFFQLAFFG